MKRIIYPRTANLESEVIYRNYRCYNYEKNEYFIFSVCNDFLRLKISEKSVKETGYLPFGSENNYYEKILRNLLNEYIYSDYNVWQPNRNFNELYNRGFPVMIMERPSLFVFVDIKDVLKACINNHNHDMLDDLYDYLKSYLEDDDKYKKYKTKYKKATALLNQIKKRSIFRDDRNKKILQLFTLILEINTK